MKICVIGNSHIAAFKLAWDELASRYENQVELVFFGSAGTNMAKSVAIQNGRLFPTKGRVKQDFYNTSGGLAEIDFSGFDAVIMTGLGCKIEHLFEAFKTHKTYDAPNRQDSAYKTMSAACLTQICMDEIGNTAIFQILSLIRTASTIPVFIIPCPLPSKDCSESWSFLTANASKTVQQSYYQGIANICKTYSATMLTQPENTITDFVFTKAVFSKGSIRFNLKTLHEETDYAHMNQAYGVEVLTYVLPIISQKPFV